MAVLKPSDARAVNAKKPGLRDDTALRQVCHRMIDDFRASKPFAGDGEVAAYLWPIAEELDREFPKEEHKC